MRDCFHGSAPLWGGELPLEIRENPSANSTVGLTREGNPKLVCCGESDVLAPNSRPEHFSSLTSRPEGVGVRHPILQADD